MQKFRVLKKNIPLEIRILNIPGRSTSGINPTWWGGGGVNTLGRA